MSVTDGIGQSQCSFEHYLVGYYDRNILPATRKC